MQSEQRDIECRLCGGTAAWVFSKLLLRKYTVGFYRCAQCQSLETEKPYWLGESYAAESLVPDFSTLRRALLMRRLVFFLWRALGMSNVDAMLDWGGGNGLLVRLLRDLGVDAHLFEPHVRNHYALGFEHVPQRRYRLVTAFQVWEHFSEPAQELDQVFGMAPDYVLVTTGTYLSQGQDWEYLNAYGRHIFCYSGQARDLIARKYSYHRVGGGDTTLFCRVLPSRGRLMAARFLCSGRYGRWLDAALPLLRWDDTLVRRDRDYAQQTIYGAGQVGRANWP